MNFSSNLTSYPSNRLNKGSNFISMFDTTLLPYNKIYDGRKFCYIWSKGTSIYRPHSDIGMVARSSVGYLHQRKRI